MVPVSYRGVHDVHLLGEMRRLEMIRSVSIIRRNIRRVHACIRPTNFAHFRPFARPFERFVLPSELFGETVNNAVYVTSSHRGCTNRTFRKFHHAAPRRRSCSWEIQRLGLGPYTVYFTSCSRRSCLNSTIDRHPMDRPTDRPTDPHSPPAPRIDGPSSVYRTVDSRSPRGRLTKHFDSTSAILHPVHSISSSSPIRDESWQEV